MDFPLYFGPLVAISLAAPRVKMCQQYFCNYNLWLEILSPVLSGAVIINRNQCPLF